MKQGSPPLAKRFELRCTPGDYRRWARRAKELGLPSVATFVRIAANEALSRKTQAPPCSIVSSDGWMTCELPAGHDGAHAMRSVHVGDRGGEDRSTTKREEP